VSLPEIPGEPPQVIIHRHYHMQMPQPRHGWMKYIVKDLETNPRSQFKVHKWGAFYWLINFPLITALYIFEPHLWLALGIFITLIYSIYANFATDYGSMSAAMAAFEPLPVPDPGESSGHAARREGSHDQAT
jgi:hypothetical protein